MWQKIFGKQQPTQSQTVGNITTNGGQVQVGQAGGDLHQAMSGENAGQQQGLTGEQVLALLEKLMGAIESSQLTVEQKRKLKVNLESAKQEAEEETPDKELIGKNLKRVSETMKQLKETTEAGKSIWKTGAEVFTKVAPWLGLAVSFFGL